MFLALLLLAQQTPASELLAPFLVQDGEHALDVEDGNSAPFLHDLDGDGLRELVVGQFGAGRVRVYTNRGTRGAPRFAGFEYLRAGEAFASVPYG
ncbi:MAG: hypothetical protein EXS08_08325 [Planctomycetes bacterium]|nr:hypothetical protein [Planctomycetota bacterium]